MPTNNVCPSDLHDDYDWYNDHSNTHIKTCSREALESYFIQLKARYRSIEPDPERQRRERRNRDIAISAFWLVLICVLLVLGLARNSSEVKAEREMAREEAIDELRAAHIPVTRENLAKKAAQAETKARED